MTTFLALYQGPSVNTAELVAVSSNRRLVSDFAQKLLQEPDAQREPDEEDTRVRVERLRPEVAR